MARWSLPAVHLIYSSSIEHKHWIHRTVRIPFLTVVDPNRKVPDLYFKVVDPKLQVTDLQAKVGELRSSEIPQFNPCCALIFIHLKCEIVYYHIAASGWTIIGNKIHYTIHEIQSSGTITYHFVVFHDIHQPWLQSEGTIPINADDRPTEKQQKYKHRNDTGKMPSDLSLISYKLSTNTRLNVKIKVH